MKIDREQGVNISEDQKQIILLQTSARTLISLSQPTAGFIHLPITDDTLIHLRHLVTNSYFGFTL